MSPLTGRCAPYKPTVTKESLPLEMLKRIVSRYVCWAGCHIIMVDLSGMVQCLFSARRLYQNELRQRVSANSLKPLNYIEESRLLIAQIEKLAVAA